jgi:membrane associated rhomboid family serine protease
MGALDPQIDNWAHLGGLLCGALMAFVIQPRVALHSSQRPWGQTP